MPFPSGPTGAVTHCGGGASVRHRLPHGGKLRAETRARVCLKCSQAPPGFSATLVSRLGTHQSPSHTTEEQHS